MASSIPSEMRAVYSNLPTSEKPPLIVKTLPTPTPGAGEVLIKMRACGMNPSDFINGIMNRFGRKVPQIMGRDFAGTIVAAPSNPGLVGKRVWGSSGDALSIKRDGTHSEYMCVPEDGVATIPDGVSFVQAGQMGTPYTTAYTALTKAQLRPRAEGEPQQTVLILAATGAVGRAAAQIATAYGHRVIRTSRRDGMEINTTTDPKLSKVAELNGGKGPDVVVDGAGDTALFEAALAVMGRGGRYAVMATKTTTEFKIDVQRLYISDQTIVGVYSGGYSLSGNQRLLQEIADLISAGKIKPEPEASFHTLKLDEAVETYSKLTAFDGKKYVLEFDE